MVHTKMNGAASRLSLLLLLAIAGYAQAAFPTFTNLLVSELAACVPAAQSDIQCMRPVITGLQWVQTVMADVHNISSTLHELITVASTTNTIVSSIVVMPIVGRVLIPSASVILGLKTSVHSASLIVQAIDGVMRRFKPKVDSVLEETMRAVTLLNTTASLCFSGGTLVSLTKSTVAALPSGPVRGDLSLTMETFSSVVREPARLAVLAMSKSGSACASIRQFVSSGLPNVTIFKEGVDNVSRFLSPIFQKLNNLWNKDYCLSLLKVAKNDAEISAIIDLIAQRKIAVRSEDGANVTDIATLNGDSRELQKLEICINLRNITSVIKEIPNFIANAFYKALNATLSELQISGAPGLPSFTSLQLFAISLHNPLLDLQFNFTVVNKLASTKFDCPSAVFDACSSLRPLTSVRATCYNPIG